METQESKLIIDSDETYKSFVSNLNNFKSEWRMDLIDALRLKGDELPDPVFTQKPRKILMLPAKINCSDGEHECEICLRKINFEDGSVGYFDMFVV